MNELQLRAEMCEIGRRLWQRGLIGACEGNLTVRLSPQRFLCTPAGKSKGHLRPDDIVVVDTKGEPVNGGVPSTEIRLHMAIYSQRPDCNAVVHAHPPISTAFALAGETIPDNYLPEAATILGSVATVPFAIPGTEEVASAITPLVADHKTFLMSHHGAVVLGTDLNDAYNRMETLERVAKILVYAKLIDAPIPMPEYAFTHYLASALDGSL